MQFVWIIATLLSGGLQVTAAVLLLRHRGAGPILMLGGAGLGMLTSIASQITVFIGNARGLWGEGETVSLHQIITLLGLVSTICWLIFSAGLLIFALQRRALRNRIDELERIAGSDR